LFKHLIHLQLEVFPVTVIKENSVFQKAANRGIVGCAAVGVLV